jgi:hypothetical protein
MADARQEWRWWARVLGGSSPVNRPAVANRLRVADLTYKLTWSGFDYAGSSSMTYLPRILVWRFASAMTTAMVLDGIEPAIWTRKCEKERSISKMVSPK